MDEHWKTQLVSCDLCGRSENETLWVKDGFRYARCFGCGAIYVNPQLLASEIARIYEVGYASKTAVTPPKADLITHRREVAFARHYYSEGRWLDVGCFNGNLLLTARDRGWQPFGTEISAPAAEYARQQGIEVFEGTLTDAHFPDDYFDVVTMMDVIEHLDQPLTYLREVQRILRPGGGVFLWILPTLAAWYGIG